MIKILACSAVLFLLTACATPLPDPKSYDERIAAAYTGLAITNDTAAILVNAGTVSKEDGRKVLAKSQEARKAVDAASTEYDLTSALDLLRAAQDLLCANRPTEPNCAYLMQRARP